MEDCVGHNCGLFGVYNVPNAAARTFLGLFALQHRGQESAGIAVSDGKTIHSKKAMGLVTEVFSKADLEELRGHITIGHVRYSTTGSSRPVNIQPLVVDYSNGLVAVAHNGNLVNAKRLRDEYEAYGSIFQTSTDSEMILHLLALLEHVGKKDQLARCLKLIKGAFSFLFMTRDKLIGARDPQGFRPLILGRMPADGHLGSIGEGYVLCSETCALDAVKAEFVREVAPGEIVEIGADGVRSSFFVPPQEIKPAHCMFEHVYFAPDSMIFGDDVHRVRIRLGERLAEEHPAAADVVIAVPDSGNAGAIGFSRRSGIPLDLGLIRNHYVGRSFIKPKQEERENVVAMKFNVVRDAVRGKRMVVVEDSLVRGTTFRKLARILREAGAAEVHLRITCPPTLHACYYGIDFPRRDELIAARLKSVAAIAEWLGVDSLRYMSVEGLLAAVSKPHSHYCTACWTGRYPVPPVDAMDKYGMENGRAGSGEGESMKEGLTYKDAGVDIRAGDAIAENIGKLAQRTYGPEVLGGVGGFAGLFSMGGQVKLLRGAYKEPVLVACTDGVGTKLKIAFMTGRHDTVGIDLVAMSVNDLIVQGAEPLFFLDYIGIEKKDPRVCQDLVAGIVNGCKQAGCALLGGETAALPGLYAPGEYDLAGFCVGVVERSKVIDGRKAGAGDVVLGIHSAGLHSNGYSLVRKALLDTAGMKLDQLVPELGCTLAHELLKPTLIYAQAIPTVLKHYKVKDTVHALAHITGSGLPGNIPRTLPRGLLVRLKKGSWPVPPIFGLVQKAGAIAEPEMYDTFNMGIGMTLICPQYNAAVIQGILADCGFASSLIGTVEAGAIPDDEALVRIE